MDALPLHNINGKYLEKKNCIRIYKIIIFPHEPSINIVIYHYDYHSIIRCFLRCVCKQTKKNKIKQKPFQESKIFLAKGIFLKILFIFSILHTEKNLYYGVRGHPVDYHLVSTCQLFWLVS